jgi:hypothetical protein
MIKRWLPFSFLLSFQILKTLRLLTPFGVPGTYLHQKLRLSQLFSSDYPFVCTQTYVAVDSEVKFPKTYCICNSNVMEMHTGNYFVLNIDTMPVCGRWVSFRLYIFKYKETH